MKWASERTSECSGGRERSEQSGASERVSGASERVNGQVSGPVLQSVFLAVIDHSEGEKRQSPIKQKTFVKEHVKKSSALCSI